MIYIIITIEAQIILEWNQLSNTIQKVSFLASKLIVLGKTVKRTGLFSLHGQSV